MFTPRVHDKPDEYSIIKIILIKQTFWIQEFQFAQKLT